MIPFLIDYLQFLRFYCSYVLSCLYFCSYDYLLSSLGALFLLSPFVALFSYPSMGLGFGVTEMTGGETVEVNLCLQEAGIVSLCDAR